MIFRSLFVTLFFTALCQVSDAQGILWVSWQEAMELSSTQEKKFFVEIYTDWCAWCKRLDESTLSQKNIISYINDKFYPIRFDGEHKEEIHFGDNTYRFVKSGRRGYHELAMEITQGQLSYPSLVFLDRDKNIIQSLSGYYSAEDFEIILEYIGGDHYKKVPWRSFYTQRQQQKATCVSNNR